MHARSIGNDGIGWWRRQPVYQHGESVFQRQFIAPAIRRAGHGEIDDALALGWHGAVGVTEGLGIKPVPGAKGKTVGLINQRRVGLVGDGGAKDQSVLGVEPERLFNLDFVVVKITD